MELVGCCGGGAFQWCYGGGGTQRRRRHHQPGCPGLALCGVTWRDVTCGWSEVKWWWVSLSAGHHRHTRTQCCRHQQHLHTTTPPSPSPSPLKNNTLTTKQGAKSTQKKKHSVKRNVEKYEIDKNPKYVKVYIVHGIRFFVCFVKVRWRCGLQSYTKDCMEGDQEFFTIFTVMIIFYYLMCWMMCIYYIHTYIHIYIRTYIYIYIVYIYNSVFRLTLPLYLSIIIILIVCLVTTY